jgi:hypothetical protein
MEPVIAETVLIPTKPAFENISIHRIQLRLTTANVSDANNDQGVYVQMNAADEIFYLYRGFDNFEKRHTDTYDVLSRHINFIKDIQFIKLGVKGSDNWIIQKLELMLNDCAFPVFTKDYGASGLNITQNQPLTIAGQVLRQAAGWNYNNSNVQIHMLPAILPKAKLLSLIEAAIGNQILDSNLAWGDYSGADTRWGPVVEVSYKNFNTLTFDLDLQKQIDGPNPEVDINFDLEFKCINGHIHFEVKNVTYDTSWWAKILEWLKIIVPELLGKVLGSVPGNLVTGGLLSKFLNYSSAVEFIPNPPPSQQACRLILVQPNCDIRLR